MKKLVFMFVLTSFAVLPTAALASDDIYSGVTLGENSAQLSTAATDPYRNTTENHGTVLGSQKNVYTGKVLGTKAQYKKKNLYDTSLTHALKAEDEDRVRMLTYTSGIDVNQRNYAGLTPLAIASEKGPLSVVKMLVRKGADVNMRSSYGITPLITATAAQQVDIAKYLISQGADATLEDEFGRSPLIYAMDFDNPQMVAVLSKKNKGAANSVDASFNTPLLYSVKKGHLQNVKTLLSNGANADYRNPKTGLFPLAVAAAENYPDIIKALVKTGKANPDLTDFSGRTPLFFAIENGNTDSVKTLLDVGANVNAQDIVGVTPLMRAVAKGNQDIVNLLLKQKKILPNLQDAQGRTALMYSAYAPNTLGAQALLAKGSEIDVDDDLGNTALLNAIQAQNDDMALFFIQQDADLAHINHQGQDAWTLAVAFMPDSKTTAELKKLNLNNPRQRQAIQEAYNAQKVQRLEKELAADDAAAQTVQQKQEPAGYLEEEVSEEVVIGLPVVTAVNQQAQAEAQKAIEAQKQLQAQQQARLQQAQLEARYKAQAEEQEILAAKQKLQAQPEQQVAAVKVQAEEQVAAVQEQAQEQAQAVQTKLDKKALKEQQKAAKAQKKAEEKAAKAKKKAKAEALKAAQQFEKAQQAANEAAAAANEAAYQAVDDSIELID